MRRLFQPRRRRFGEGRGREAGGGRLSARRAGVAAGAFVILSILVTPSQFLRRPDVTEGSIARYDVVAPYKFAVEKDVVTFRQEQEEAAARVLPVFRVNENIAGIAQDELHGFFVVIQQLAATYRSKRGVEREAFLDELSINVSRPVLIYLLEAGDLESVRARASDILGRIMARGVLDYEELERRRLGKTITLARGEGDGEEVISVDELLTPASAAGEARRLVAQEKNLTPLEADVVAEVVAISVKPNVLYDAAATERRRRAAREAVDPIERWVDENEKIVERNKVVTAAQMRALEALYSTRTVKNLAVSLGGRSLLVAAVLVLVGVFFYRYRRPYFSEARYWWITAIILTAACFVSRLLMMFLQNYGPLALFVFATALGAMLITLLTDAAFGIVVAVALSLLAGVMGGMALRPTLVALFASGVGVVLVSRLRRRSDFYRVFLGLFAAGAVAAMGVGLIDMLPGRDIAEEVWWSAVMAAASVVVLAVMLPVFEMTFQVVTDLRLLELADLNHPLLRRLLLEAPGTYHHSVVVGNLAELAAGAVGVNPLLARVAAYYHDIGKLRAPAYFAENATGDVTRHEHLSPQMSTLIVASHTKQGAKMAEDAGLPADIVNTIAEHHGTSLISFFYQEALKLDEHKVLAEDDFRYPGPKPQSKVSAIVMLADAVESASRALDQPTPTSIRATVEKVVAARLADGQLDECDLSLREIQQVKESLIRALASVYHIRPTYPEDGEQFVVPHLSPHSTQTETN